MTAAANIGSIRRTIRKTARVLHITAAAVYCAGFFLQCLNWSPSVPGMASLGAEVRDITRIVAMVLLLEQFNVSPRRGWTALGILAVNVGFFWYRGYWGPTDLFFFWGLSDSEDENAMKNTLLGLYLAFSACAGILLWTGAVVDHEEVFLYRVGHSFGFVHPNMLGMFLVSLVVVLRLTVLKNNRVFIAACLGAAAFAWFGPASRTAVLLLLLYPVLALGLDWFQRKGKHGPVRAFRFLPAAVAAVCIGLSALIAAGVLSWETLQRIDPNSMMRFVHPAEVIRDRGISLLGGSLPPGIPFENTYLYVLLRFGVFWAAAWIAFLTAVMCRLVKAEKAEYIAAFALVILQGVMENTVLIPLFNVIPLFT